MLSMYPACFFKEETGYSVIFPDLELATCGKTLDEAMSMAVDCLAGRLWWLKRDGDTIPAWLNAAALEMDINFSQVLQDALIAKVQAR